MTAPYIQPIDPTVQNAPTDTPQRPAPAKSPPATLPPAPRWDPKGDEIVSPPYPDK